MYFDHLLAVLIVEVECNINHKQKKNNQHKRINNRKINEETKNDNGKNNKKEVSSLDTRKMLLKIV